MDACFKGVSGETGSGGGEEPVELLSEIIKKVSSVYGIDLRDEDKVDLQNVEKRMIEDKEMAKVYTGNNSEDVKSEFYEKLLKEKFVDYTGDRLDFYKKVMDNKIFDLIKDTLYQNYKNLHKANLKSGNSVTY